MRKRLSERGGKSMKSMGGKDKRREEKVSKGKRKECEGEGVRCAGERQFE